MHLLTAVAGACCLFIAVPAQAAATRPEWTPYRTAPFVLPAGTRCPFGLSGTPVRDRERIRTLATFPDGTPRVQEVAGPLVVRYTNTDSGTSVVRDLTGRASVTYGADGGFRETLESGHFAVGLAATDPGGPGFFVLSGAGAALTVNADGSRVLTPGRARVENICTTLAGHDAAGTIARMTAHYHDPALEFQNKPFAVLYLRTTEGMRDANAAGEFSDPRFWDQKVIPLFAQYYLDAYAAWKRGSGRDVDPAWRIAFQADPKLTCTQLIYLGINAHVNNDLAFVIDELGDRYLYADHLHVDDVLAVRIPPVVFPEIQRDLCPGLFSETIPPTADADIVAWRQLAWDNAQRLRDAPNAAARKAIAREIRRHATDKALEIIGWNRPATALSR